MVPSQVITGARVVLNDPAGGTPRWSDATLLGYFNDFMKALAVARGELFITPQYPITLVSGEVQTVSKVDTLGLVDVLKNGVGEYVREVDLMEMTTQARGWAKSTKGAFKVFARKPPDLFTFYVYPPAKGGETAICSVITEPADVLIADVDTAVPVANAYRAAGVNYVAGRALAVNTNAADVQKGTALVATAMTFAGVKA